MEYDFSDKIAEQVRANEPDLDARLEAQAEALSELKCINPLIGKWIDEYDVEYLLSAFALDDHSFAENFPSMSHVTEHHRKRIIKEFKRHLGLCLHCSRKQSYDEEINQRIEQALQDNKALIIEQTGSTEALSETDLLRVLDPVISE